jgi:hypothetical protein
MGGKLPAACPQMGEKIRFAAQAPSVQRDIVREGPAIVQLTAVTRLDSTAPSIFMEK